MKLHHFDGPFYEPEKDQVRLSTQMERVKAFMLDKEWHILQELVDRCGPGTMTAMSARVRDLRKPRHGSYKVETQRVEGGLYRYRVL
jgi:hypothetical protein